MFVIRYRWWIIISTILVVIISGLLLFRVEINPDLETYLPEQMSSRKNTKVIYDVFGESEPILITIKADDVLATSTLERIQDISDAFAQELNYKNVFSLFEAKNIRSEEGAMIVDPIIQVIPQTDEEREILREEIKKNDLAYKLVVSEDFKYALIILNSDKTMPDDELMENLKETLSLYPGPEEVEITGQPYLRQDANNKISHDLMILLPVGLIVMFLMLLISFKEIRAVLLPFSVVVFSIIVALGMIPLFGWKLGIIGVLIPIMMIAIANNYGVYFIARYQDLNANQPHLGMYRIVQHSVNYLTRPVLFCGLTTIVGILGLVAHLLLPARQMGVVSGIAIAFALIVSLMFIPAVMSMMKKGKPHKDLSGDSNGFFFKLLHGAGNLVNKNTKVVLTGFAVFFVLCTLGLMFFKVAPDANTVLPKSHSFNKGIDIVDENFGGSKMINLMIEGDVKEPELMNKLDKFEQEIESMENVGNVTSLATIVREISKAMNDSTSPEFGKIPQSREAIAQYLELYSMSSDPEDIEQFVDFDYTNTLVNVQFKADNIADINQLVDDIKVKLDDKSSPLTIAGYSLIEKEMSESIMKGQNYSLIFAFVAIIILLSIIFRSFTAGLLGSLPLVFAVFCTFGLMGWLGLELNIVTALLSSISIGLGVDFTIHIFWRIKWELAAGRDYATSVRNTLTTIGRGISINAFSVMVGFAVLFISAFPLIRSFAFLIIISLFLCLISALVLIPALCITLKPKFLERKG